MKKLPRVHQYFAVKAAQEHVRQHKGGIIWHTQGSGKSIVMVLLAKWILENNPHARVVIITDRDELDKQIERFFSDAGETIYRTSSGRDLMHALGQAAPRLLCSLVHKFGASTAWMISMPSSRNCRRSPARRWARSSSSWTSATAPRAASCTGR